MKALHPSDHEIKSTKVPGGTENSVAIAIDETFTLPVPTIDGQPCPVLVRQQPNIAVPVSCFATGGAAWGDAEYHYNFINPGLTAGSSVPAWLGTDDTNHSALRSATLAVADRFEQFRITSQSITLELIAPALADQGTITSVQVTDTYWDIPFSNNDMSQAAWGFTTGVPCPLFRFHDSFPNETRMLGAARGMTGPAREGVYQPLRLTHFDFGSVANNIVWADVVSQSNLPTARLPGTGYTPVYTRDYWGIGPDFSIASDVQRYTIANSGTNVGYTLLKGLSKDASIRIRVRITLEALVRPATAYYSLVDGPYPPDDTALKMYREIAGRMKDAYPARYNDWDKLKETIKSMAKKILPIASPALAAITAGLPFGGAINQLGQAALSGLGKWASTSKAVVPAQIQAASQALVAQRSAKPKRKRNHKKKNGPTSQALVPAGSDKAAAQRVRQLRAQAFLDSLGLD